MEMSSLIDWTVKCGRIAQGNLELLFLALGPCEYAVVPGGQTINSMFPMIITKDKPIRIIGSWRTIQHCLDALGSSDNIRELQSVINMGLVTLSGKKRTGKKECPDTVLRKMLPFNMEVCKTCDLDEDTAILKPDFLEEYGAPHWIITAMQYNDLVTTEIDEVGLMDALLPSPLEVHGTWDASSKYLLLAHGIETSLMRTLEVQNMGIRRVRR